MIKLVWQNIIRFIFLILLQVLILNNIQFSGFINPYLYVLFILLLPIELSNWIVLFIGLLTGLCVDVFSNTLGIHASATVFISFLRPFILGIISPREGYEPGTLPNISHNGLKWFVKYIVILVVAHHLFLFFVEAFRFSDFFRTFSRAIISSVFTLILILFTQMLLIRRKK
ncbi:MAG: rod shape-determining protein MreD [Bacteroidota bacterium]